MKHENQNKKDENFDNPLSAWFLGPKAEHSRVWSEMINHIFNDYVDWRRNYFPNDPIVITNEKRLKNERWFNKLSSELDIFLNELKAHYPFYSPRYNAHMLSEQSLPSVLGYFAGMLYNPNNVTDEAAPITVPLEIEVGKMVARMLGYNPNTSWTHITSGGTIANAEALWIARIVQLAPLIINDYCKKNKLEFFIKTPNSNNSSVDIRDLTYQELLSLSPNESILMYRKLAEYLIKILGFNKKRTISDLNKFIKESKFNVSTNGLYNVLNILKLKPVIFISESAHYSIKKLCNLIGYGENVINFVPVKSNFRINTQFLEEKINSLKTDEYVAMVIGILGTTGEGAIDQIHEINFIRDDWGKNNNKSFWLHVDAAWGGYIKSLFNHPDLKDKKDYNNFNEVCDVLKNKLKINETFDVLIDDKKVSSNVKVDWSESDIYKSFIALNEADSITIDPHKLGYVPYPAGMISFQNGVVTEHIIQKAQYISDSNGGLKNIDQHINIDAVGPFILEGSKSGAAAASCWLAHKFIPLDTHGHGKIIRTSLLNTKKFITYLDLHKQNFKHFNKSIFHTESLPQKPFTYKYLYVPDSNIVCFIAIPMKWVNESLNQIDFSLQELNSLNKKLYAQSSINDDCVAYYQEFFVSRTTFENEQYSYKSIQIILDQLNINKKDYMKYGLFVLRSTIMNPLHSEAKEAGMDYLMEFIKYLHKVTTNILNN